MNSLPPDQRTMTTQDVIGTKIEAIPGMGVCDFCTAVPIEVRYPCGLVVVELPGGAHASSDPWAACADCHALIEAGDRDGLAQRALLAFIAQEGVPPADVMAQIAPMFREVQDAFFASRLGDAQPV
jgi:hypothetical protein